MDQRVMQIYVGLMVLAAILIAGILLLLTGRTSFFERRYPIYVRFDTTPRVTADTPIRKNGILIGRVQDVEFAEYNGMRADDSGVVVTMGIDPQYRIRHNEMFQIDAELLGDATIQVVPTDTANQPATTIDQGEYVPDGRTRPRAFDALEDLQRDLPATLNKLALAADNVGQLANTMNRVVVDNEAEFKSIVTKGETMIDTAQRTLSSLDDLLGDPETRGAFKEAVGNAPKVMEQARTALSQVANTFALLDSNLQNLEGFTEPLGERGPAIIENVDRAIAQMSGLVEDMRGVSTSLRNPEGTFGKLLNDDEMYNNANTVMRNIDELTKQLKPILYDLRVFSDKIARHPGVIVGDAVRPGTGVKGTAGKVEWERTMPQPPDERTYPR